jgi:hypothetical protein
MGYLCHNTGHKDTQLNDIQHDDTQQKGLFVTLTINDNQYNNTLALC